LALQCRFVQVIRQQQIHQRLTNILSDMVTRERGGEIVDKALLRSITQVLRGSSSDAGSWGRGWRGQGATAAGAACWHLLCGHRGGGGLVELACTQPAVDSSAEASQDCRRHVLLGRAAWDCWVVEEAATHYSHGAHAYRTAFSLIGCLCLCWCVVCLRC
jgi:hypothetical protein